MLKVVVWPFVALVALFLFYQPIKEQFLAGNITRVKVGILELNMKETDLPSVSDQSVATALLDLPETGVVTLLFAGKSGYNQCAGDQDLQQFDEEFTAPFEDLERRGLVTLKETNDADGKCLFVEPTDRGLTARRFISDLIAAQLKTAKAN